MKFAIVTTCFQSGRFLIDTLQSVISQAGDFSLHYHVQDAGTIDGSLALLKSQVEQIERGNTPIQCRELTFSYVREPDQVIYNSINRGFRQLLRQVEADVMLWIKADDTLAPGALTRLARYFGDHIDVSWLIGRTRHMDEHGNITLDIPPHAYYLADLAAGRHDGILLPCVMQEATVWRTKVWKQCGEFDGRLRYAGDFEYWMRVARNGYKLHSVDVAIGHHRKYPEQLSAAECYADEIRFSIMNREKKNGK